jgi:hypothetical protein
MPRLQSLPGSQKITFVVSTIPEAAAMWRAMAAASLLTLVAGCMSFDLGDSKADLDEYVDETLTYTEQRKATDYFSSGGSYWADGSDESNKLDREVLLPLCQRLESEFKAETFALVSTDDGTTYTEALAMKAPADAAVRNSIDAAVKEADGRYDGSITVDWGNKWATIDVEDPEDLE